MMVPKQFKMVPQWWHKKGSTMITPKQLKIISPMLPKTVSQWWHQANLKRFHSDGTKIKKVSQRIFAFVSCMSYKSFLAQQN